jgi:hypothetical protein
VSAAQQGPRSWRQVEQVASFTLIGCLLAFIGSRLFFAVWWPLHPLDFAISSVAVALLVGSFWFAMHRRGWRIAVIVFASATQLVPVVAREPKVLLPLLGALIPVGVLVGCLVALSKKGSGGRPHSGS